MKSNKSVKKNVNKAVEYTKSQITKGIRKTRELKFYIFNFFVRLTFFSSVLFLYIRDREGLVELITGPFWKSFSFIHIVWIYFMVIMILHIIPNNKLTMAWKKAKESEFRPVENYDELEMLKFAKNQNQRAMKVMLIWLFGNGLIGALYLFDVLIESDMFMLTVFYFLCDYICILFFCPFQTGIMKNKCCINCRIYDWGHFMMFTPMLFVKNFFCWSLFFTSLIVLISWEIKYSQHPERFWEKSNQTLQCKNCKERTCQIKRTIKGKLNKKKINKIENSSAKEKNLCSANVENYDTKNN
ncbi:MAG: hypothetical protein IJX17_04230 [Clostridia bacterium]|nr:hypothetical protein [Clostridia bacterium]